VDFAVKAGYPSVYVRKEWVELGGLISYGVDQIDHYRRAAVFVDKS
jgi:hypothetical protein